MSKFLDETKRQEVRLELHARYGDGTEVVVAWTGTSEEYDHLRDPRTYEGAGMGRVSTEMRHRGTVEIVPPGAG